MMATIIGVAFTVQTAVGLTQFISTDGLFVVFIAFLALWIWLGAAYVRAALNLD